MAERKKILIFSLAYHPFVGGAEVAIKEITDRLPDFDFEMITANLDGQQKAEERIGNIKVYRVNYVINYLIKYLFPWRAYKKAVALHRENNYDAIWAMMANQAGWAALKFKKRFPEVKYLLTLQEGDSEWDIWWRTFFIQPIYKAIYRRADRIQAISSFLANRAKKLGAKCEVGVIPNGSEIELFFKDKASYDDWQARQRDDYFHEQIQKLNLSYKKNIITTSRLVRKNGLIYLIRAMKEIDANLLILGDGLLRNKLLKVTSKLNLRNKIKFLGEIKREEIVSYYWIADAFVRPSLSEGLGISFLEAIAAGVPVIGTKVGGIPDFLKDGDPADAKAMASKTGWFCEVKNPKSITEKINYVLDEKNKDEVARVVENAWKVVEQNYNWDKIAKQMETIFNSLAA